MHMQLFSMQYALLYMIKADSLPQMNCYQESHGSLPEELLDKDHIALSSHHRRIPHRDAYLFKFSDASFYHILIVKMNISSWELSTV